MKLLLIAFITLALSACSVPFGTSEPAEPVSATVPEPCICEEEQPTTDVSDVGNEPTEVPVNNQEPVAQLPTDNQAPVVEGQEPVNAPNTSPTFLEPPINNAILGNLRFIDYVVAPGDTLGAIASAHGVTIANLQEWNQLPDFNIYAGQTLAIGQDISVFLEEQSETVSATLDYLLNGQAEKPEVERLNWNEGFLNKLDLTALHQQFVDGGANPEDVENFAIWLTRNAPIQETWEQEFRLQAFSEYQAEITRLESIGGDDFQAYTTVNGVETPFAIVSSRTGYFIR